MILLPAVKAALTTALDGHEDFEVVDYLGEWDEEIPARMVLFGDSADIDATALYEVDSSCGIAAVKEYVEDGRLVVWITAMAESNESTASELEAIRNLAFAKLVQTVAADQTLGIEIPGVRTIQINVESSDASNKAMRATQGGDLVPAARVVVELSLRCRIEPASLTIASS